MLHMLNGTHLPHAAEDADLPIENTAAPHATQATQRYLLVGAREDLRQGVDGTAPAAVGVRASSVPSVPSVSFCFCI